MKTEYFLQSKIYLYILHNLLLHFKFCYLLFGVYFVKNNFQ